MDWSPSRLDEIDALFRELLALEPRERARRLRRVVAVDPDLGTAVARLLSASEAEEDPVGRLGDDARRAAWVALAAEEEEPGAWAEGDHLGRYRILDRLARGGWGTVYLAERDDGAFRRRVAVKVLRRGLDTEDVVTRFRAERQILATLGHPNIARLLDGGTTEDGRPFLVLEYVEGRRIDDYCDDHRLSLEERLRLFVVVARAVQHAHRSLVIHRDLKPSNILVTDEGGVKLLDFGIAKLLDPSAVPADTPATRTGHSPMTPEYASPEQLRGETVTTASDVFQLGLLLHVLLVGRRPEVQHGPDGPPAADPPPPSRALRKAGDEHDAKEIAEARGTDPERLERALRGDLDTIVSTALRTEPERRYASADHLADDIERYLAGLPVSARPDTVAYRSRKFLQRHRWFAPAVAAVLVLAAAYVGTLARHAAQLERERNLAREEAARAQEVKEVLMNLFESPDPFAPLEERQGRDVTVAEALASGAERVRAELAGRPALRAELLGTISEVLERLDLTEEALGLREEALEDEMTVFGDGSLEVARSLGRVGSLLHRAGALDSAEVLERRSIALVEALHGREHRDVADALVRLGLLHFDQGRMGEARSTMTEAVEIYRRLEPPPTEPLAAALETLTRIHLEFQGVDAAEASAAEAVELRRATFGPDHPATALATVALAHVHYGRRAYDEAERLYGIALPVLDRELGPTHWRTLTALNDYALVLSREGDHAGAEAIYRRLLDARREKYGAASEPVGSTLQNLAVTLARQGRREEAAALHLEARETFRRVLGPTHHLTAFPLLSLAQLQLDQERYVRAEASAREAVDVLEEALPRGHFATQMARCRLGRALAGQGRTAQARRLLEASVEHLRASTQVPVEYQRECEEALGTLATGTRP